MCVLTNAPLPARAPNENCVAPPARRRPRPALALRPDGNRGASHFGGGAGSWLRRRTCVGASVEGLARASAAKVPNGEEREARTGQKEPGAGPLSPLSRLVGARLLTGAPPPFAPQAHTPTFFVLLFHNPGYAGPGSFESRPVLAPRRAASREPSA